MSFLLYFLVCSWCFLMNFSYFFISEIYVCFFCVSFSLSSVLKFYLRPSRTFVVAAWRFSSRRSAVSVISGSVCTYLFSWLWATCAGFVVSRHFWLEVGHRGFPVFGQHSGRHVRYMQIDVIFFSFVFKLLRVRLEELLLIGGLSHISWEPPCS